MIKKKGISLIVLVITIIITIILAGAVIASFTNEGISGKAEEMKFKTNMSGFAEELSNYISGKEHEYTVKGEVYDGSTLTATKDYLVYDGEIVEGKNILDVIPSLEQDEDENYVNKFKVVDGELKYIAEYQESSGVVTKTKNNNDTESVWANSLDIETVNTYTESSNIMRTEFYEKAELETPSYKNNSFKEENINDGVKSSTPFFYTNGAQEDQNIGWGTKITFKEKVPLKKMVLYGYSFKVKELTIEAYVNGKWEVVKKQEFSNTNPYIMDLSENVVFAKEWKIYISKVTTQTSNFYGFEVEAYM